MVSGSFFTPLSEVLFTFPSRYSFAIGLSVVFSLAGWSPRIQPGFLVSRPTQVPPAGGWGLRVRGFHPLRRLFQPVPLTPPPPVGGPTTPARASPRRRFGLIPVRSPLLGNRSYFLFLRVLRCFSSPRSPPEYSRMPGSLPAGCPIRTSTGQGIFAPRRGFSQLVTSFIASESQGIPMRPCFIPLYGQAARPLVWFSPKPFVPSPTNGDGARCVLFEFSTCLLAAGLRNLSPFVCRFHHVNVLFPKWRITESNR